MRNVIFCSKKKLAIIIAIVLILGFSGIILLSSNIFDNENHIYKGYAFKTWLIYCDNETLIGDIGDSDISVKDTAGTNVEISMIHGIFPKTIIVLPPKEGYQPGDTYTISANNGFSLGKNNGQAIHKIDFNILENDKNKIVKFKDKNLENIVRKTINKSSGSIMSDDLKNVTELVATSENIADISGIENMTNLKEVYLDNNNIKDISKLSKLYDLQCLGLSGNKITDIKALKNLKNLYKLSLNNNKIKSYKALDNIFDNLVWKDFKIN